MTITPATLPENAWWSEAGADDTAAVPPPLRGDERATLAGFLRQQRDVLERKCAGLDAAALARRSAAPSALSLLGLVRHLADVERGWFREVLAGHDVPPRFSSAADPDGDFRGAAPDPALVDEARDLDATGYDTRRGPVSVRWVLLHVIEEYARHNGHADLFRQRLDGATGE